MAQHRCPQCHERSGVPILYGDPGEEMMERSKRQEIVLGGCVMEDDAPNRHCLSCQHQWSTKRGSKP